MFGVKLGVTLQRNSNTATVQLQYWIYLTQIGLLAMIDMLVYVGYYGYQEVLPSQLVL